MRLAPAAITLAVGLAAAPAWSQLDSREAIALQNQILELRRDLQGLQAQRGAPALPLPVRRGGDGGGSEIAAQLLDRVAQLEDDVRRLRGQLDEQANASRRQMDDLSKQVADLNFRLQNSGLSGGPGPRASNPDALAAPPAGGPVPSGRRPAELAMQEGNAALARRDYGVAEAAAREVLSGGRGGPRAGDAQFLLAQALMGKRDYPGAAVAYDDAYNRSRTGSRAPDALLGLANALAALNDRANACAALDKLRTEFPAPRPNVRDAAAAARGRSGCS